MVTQGQYQLQRQYQVRIRNLGKYSSEEIEIDIDTFKAWLMCFGELREVHQQLLFKTLTFFFLRILRLIQ